MVSAQEALRTTEGEGRGEAPSVELGAVMLDLDWTVVLERLKEGSGFSWRRLRRVLGVDGPHMSRMRRGLSRPGHAVGGRVIAAVVQWGLGDQVLTRDVLKHGSLGEPRWVPVLPLARSGAGAGKVTVQESSWPTLDDPEE